MEEEKGAIAHTNPKTKADSQNQEISELSKERREIIEELVAVEGAVD